MYVIIVDIFYDHFLAKNWSRFSDVPLDDYVHDIKGYYPRPTSISYPVVA